MDLCTNDLVMLNADFPMIQTDFIFDTRDFHSGRQRLMFRLCSLPINFISFQDLLLLYVRIRHAGFTLTITTSHVQTNVWSPAGSKLKTVEIYNKH